MIFIFTLLGKQFQVSSNHKVSICNDKGCVHNMPIVSILLTNLVQFVFILYSCRKIMTYNPTIWFHLEENEFLFEFVCLFFPHHCHARLAHQGYKYTVHPDFCEATMSIMYIIIVATSFIETGVLFKSSSIESSSVKLFQWQRFRIDPINVGFQNKSTPQKHFFLLYVVKNFSQCTNVCNIQRLISDNWNFLMIYKK